MNTPSLLVDFVTDGRIYESPGGRGDNFICVFGDLIASPHPRPKTVTFEFAATLTHPDGTTLDAAYAHLDYPMEGEGTEHFVLLRGVDPGQVPPGTRITSCEA